MVTEIFADREAIEARYEMERNNRRYREAQEQRPSKATQEEIERIAHTVLPAGEGVVDMSEGQWRGDIPDEQFKGGWAPITAHEDWPYVQGRYRKGFAQMFMAGLAFGVGLTILVFSVLAAVR